MTFRTAIPVMVLLVIGTPAFAQAQVGQDLFGEQVRLVRTRLATETEMRPGLAPAVPGLLDNALSNLPIERRSPGPQQGGSPKTGKDRSVGRAILGGAVGGVGGFFGGAYLGAAIEGDDCNCDDPGFKGFLIGAPIGAAVGAVLGALFLF